MAKKRKKHVKNIVVSLNFNHDKTEVCLTMECETPIIESEFIIELVDFVEIFGDGFNFAEIGEFVPFDFLFDEDEEPPDGVYH